MSLKNEIKNQQAVIEIVITGDKCGNKWKVVKDKSGSKIMTNTNKTSACSMLSKVPSPMNL